MFVPRGLTLRLLHDGTSPAHDDPSENDKNDVVRRACDCGANEEDDEVGAVHPLQVEAVRDLASKGEEGEVGEGVGQADPGEELNVAKDLVEARLNVCDVADVVSCER